MLLLLNHLLSLLNDLVDPDLNFLLHIVRLLFRHTFFADLLLPRRAPCIPLIHEPFPEGGELCTDIALIGSILLVKRSAVLLQILADLLLPLLCEQWGRSRSPDELFESILNLFGEFLSTEVPDREAVFKLEKLEHVISWSKVDSQCVSMHSRSWQDNGHWDPIPHPLHRSGQRFRAIEYHCPIPLAPSDQN